MFPFILVLLLSLYARSATALWASPATAPSASYAYPLSALGPHIVDATNRTIQLRCANWPGHMETMLPEGLQWQPLPALVALLAQPNVFNCIRLTYSVELFYAGANLTARQSFARLGLNSTIAQVEAANPQLIDLPLLAVRDAVVAECSKAGIMVLFDNQMSKSGWCCSEDDGNGWWNDRFFNVSQWLGSLQMISSHYAKIAPNAVAYSLRNELRTNKKSRDEQVSDWLTYVPQGMDAVHAGNPDALIFVSGLNYDNDWTFLNGLDHSSAQGGSSLQASAAAPNASEWQRVYSSYAGQLVFESHIYSWDSFGTYTDNCSDVLAGFDAAVGYPQQHGRPHVLTELGLSQDDYPYTRLERQYFHCVTRWVLDNQLGWGIWLFSGSYYVRDGRPNVPDSFGSVTVNHTEYKNPAFLQALRNASWENAPAATYGRLRLGGRSRASGSGDNSASKAGAAGLLYTSLVIAMLAGLL